MRIVTQPTPFIAKIEGLFSLTLLPYNAVKKLQVKHPMVLKRLLDPELHPKLKMPRNKFEDGEPTVLHSAALEDNVELVESLAIRFGADYIDGKNRLPFEVAGIPSRIILQRLQLYLERYDIDSYNVRLNQNQPC